MVEGNGLMARPRTISQGETTQTAFRLASEDLRRLEQLAAKDNVTVGELIRRAITKKLEENNG
jgi:predicted DNA-binding protein